MALALLAGDPLEVGHVGGGHGAAVDLNVTQATNFLPTLIILNKNGEVLHILELQELQLYEASGQLLFS